MKLIFGLIFFSYFTFNYQVFAIGTYGVVLADVLVPILFFIILKEKIWEGKKVTMSLHSGVYFLIAFFLALLISGVNPLFNGSKDMLIQFFKTFIHTVFFVSYAFIILLYPVPSNIWKTCINVWLICSLIVNIFGIYQIAARAYDLPLATLEITNVSFSMRGETDMDSVSQLSLRYGNFFRATSIFAEPSSLAIFNVFIQAFLIVPYVQKREPFLKSKYLKLFIFIFSLLAMFLTFSMTAFIGLAMIAGTIILFERRIKLLTIFKALIPIIILLVIADSIAEHYFEVSVLELFRLRLEGLLNFGSGRKMLTYGETIENRLGTIEMAIIVWKEYLLTGIGIGLSDYNEITPLTYCDSGAFGLLAETGIVGGVTYFGLYISTMLISGYMAFNKELLKDLPAEDQSLGGLMFYVMLAIVLCNFITGNQITSYGSWMPLAMVLSVINSIYLKKNKYCYSFFLVKTPPKLYIQKAISKYIEYKEKKI